jgi:hypothetical protein
VQPAAETGSGPRRPAVPPVAEGEVVARWQEFVAEVRRQRISLGSTLAATKFLGIRDGAVRIGCADDFAMETIQRNKEPLAEMFQKIFRVSVRLEVERSGTSTEPPDDPSPPDVPSGDEHPVISAMKRELGAEPL